MSPRQRRARVFKKGKMIFDNGLRSVPCLVRNISDGGAMLQFEQAQLLPREFDLQIDLDGFEVSCERRWEDGLTCGVQFIGEKREVVKLREQVLKTSEQALKKETDERRQSLDGFFQRTHPAPRPAPAATQVHQPRAPSGKSFGKRR